MPEKLKKSDILTIPNLLSLFRIILIPFIIRLYCTKESYLGAFALVALSGLTDVLDGKIARRYNMITAVGKILDPLADKLTQAALIICLISRYRLMWALIALFILKELVSTALGYLSMQASGTVTGAMWYGKVNTVILYAVMIVLIVFPNIPPNAANGLIILCSASLLLAFILYVRFFWKLVSTGPETLRKMSSWQAVARIIAACLWLVVILFCLVYRNRITVDTILNFTPESTWLAALCMIALFAFKSVSVFIYAGILYAASGVMFPLPVALLVNIFGSAVMFVIPYLMGRTGGAEMMEKLAQKHPKIKLLRGFPLESKFFLSFITRIVGIIPADVVSLYMGAVRADFPQYISGSLLGMLVSITTFTVMGVKVNDPGSPEFIIALIAEVAINLLSLLAFILYKRHLNKTR